MPEIKQTDVVGTQIKVKEQVVEEQVRGDEVYEEYIHEDWTPDVIPQRTDEEKEKLSPEKEPIGQAKKSEKLEKLHQIGNLMNSILGKTRRYLKNKLKVNTPQKMKYMKNTWMKIGPQMLFPRDPVRMKGFL